MMADDTLGLIDHIGIEKAHIIGASMGGTIAQELAINHPERVNKLVLACTLARRDRTSGFTSKFNKALDAYDKSSRSEADLRRFTSVYISLRVNKRPNRIERARSLARELLFPLMKIVLRFPATTGLPEQLEAFSTHDATDRLGMIKASTLVITGTEDRLIKPISSEVIANLVPKAKLVKVPGGSHSFIMEMSDEFNREVLDFLKN
jgi:pimeloyl-ACP methyl ester carboxylesterase